MSSRKGQDGAKSIVVSPHHGRRTGNTSTGCQPLGDKGIGAFGKWRGCKKKAGSREEGVAKKRKIARVASAGSERPSKRRASFDFRNFSLIGGEGNKGKKNVAGERKRREERPKAKDPACFIQRGVKNGPGPRAGQSKKKR